MVINKISFNNMCIELDLEFIANIQYTNDAQARVDQWGMDSRVNFGVLDC